MEQRDLDSQAFLWCSLSWHSCGFQFKRKEGILDLTCRFRTVIQFRTEKMAFRKKKSLHLAFILVSSSHDPFGLRKGTRPLDWVCEEYCSVIFSQSELSCRLDNYSVNPRLLVLEEARGLDSWCNTSPIKSMDRGPWGRKLSSIKLF